MEKLACSIEEKGQMHPDFSPEIHHGTTAAIWRQSGKAGATLFSEAEEFPAEAQLPMMTQGALHPRSIEKVPEAAHTQTVLPCKRRRVDSDGFVLPGTPTQQPCHYEDYSPEHKKDKEVVFPDTEAFFAEEKEDPKTKSSPPKKSMWFLLKDLGQETKLLNNSWAQVFSDGESFELFCTTRLDKLQEEANALEQKLLQQKQHLYNRLQNLSKTLNCQDTN